MQSLDRLHNSGKTAAPWLFILPSRIGDAVLTTGIINWVRHTKQDVKIVLASSSLVGPLFRDLPELVEIIPFNEKKYDLHWLELWNTIRHRQWQGIVDFKGSLVSLFVRAKKRYIRTSPKKSQGKMHRVEELSCLIDKDPRQDNLAPFLWINPERERSAGRILGERPTLAIAPTANWVGKQWPVERFIAVVRAFLEKHGDAQVAVFAAPHEKEQVGSLLEQLAAYALLDLIRPDLDLLTIAACIGKCRLFLGNDSGLMHISVAVGTPTIGLFGPSDDAVYGPWSSSQPSPHVVIRGVQDLAELEARPGFSFSAKDACYMDEIRTETVLDAVLQRWPDPKEHDLFGRQITTDTPSPSTGADE